MKKTQNSRVTGQGLVEFAIALPIVLMLIFGLIEFGRVLFVYSVVNTASREAARYGIAVGEVTGGEKRYYDCDGIRAAAMNIGVFAGMQDADISISYDRGPDEPVLYFSCEGLATHNGDDLIQFGDRIVVTATVTYSPFFTTFLNIPDLSITATSARSIVTEAKVVDQWDDPGSSGELPTPSPTFTDTPNPLYTPTMTFTPTETPILPTATNTVPAPYIPPPLNPRVLWDPDGNNCINIRFLFDVNPSWAIDPGVDPAKYQVLVKTSTTYITAIAPNTPTTTWWVGPSFIIKNGKTAEFGTLAVFPGLNTSGMATIKVECDAGSLVVIP